MSIDCMNHVWKESRHKGTNLLALLALADRANEHGVCWPGVTDISKRARTEKRHAKRVIAQLYQSGELYFENGGGRHRTNLYLVCIGMEPQQILDALTQRQFFQMTPLEARVALAEIQERQTAFAVLAQNGGVQDTVSNDATADDLETHIERIADEFEQNGGADARKGVMEDTLSTNGGADARNSDAHARKGVMDARNSDAHARKGVIAVSPQPSLTINESSSNPKETADIFLKDIKEELALTLARAAYVTHIEPLTAVSYRNGASPPTLTLAAHQKSMFWLTNRLRVPIERSAEHVVGKPVTLVFQEVQP